MPRKKAFKKSAYYDQPRCFGREDALKGRWRSEVFGNDHPLTFELGCGKAAWSLGMAARYPDRNFVGVDLKTDRMWHAARDAQAAGLTNVAFLFAHLLQLDEQVAENEADELWITFPDPFSKKRQAKHRMINPPFLAVYRKLLRPGGELHFKTDNRELFHYSLEVLVREPDLRFDYLTFDLHAAEEAPADALITTGYEEKFLEMGKEINYVAMRFET